MDQLSDGPQSSRSSIEKGSLSLVEAHGGPFCHLKNQQDKNEFNESCIEV